MVFTDTLFTFTNPFLPWLVLLYIPNVFCMVLWWGCCFWDVLCGSVSSCPLGAGPAHGCRRIPWQVCLSACPFHSTARFPWLFLAPLLGWALENIFFFFSFKYVGSESELYPLVWSVPPSAMLEAQPVKRLRQSSGSLGDKWSLSVFTLEIPEVPGKLPASA